MNFPRIYNPNRIEPARCPRRVLRRSPLAWLHAAAIDFGFYALIVSAIVGLAAVAANAQCGPGGCGGGSSFSGSCSDGSCGGSSMSSGCPGGVCPMPQSYAPPQQQQQARRWPDPTIMWIDGYTGTTIDIGGYRSFVLTCAHGPEYTGARVTVTNGLGRQFAAVCVDCDQASDVAILQLTNVRAEYVARIAAAPPAIGTPLTITGFGGGNYAVKPLSSGYNVGGANAGPGVCTFGDSGGPVRNPQNEIVGVLSGTDNPGGQGGVHYGKLKAIHAAIERVRMRIPGQRPAVAQTPAADPSCAVAQTPPAGQHSSSCYPSCTCDVKWEALDAWRSKLDDERTQLLGIIAALKSNQPAVAGSTHLADVEARLERLETFCGRMAAAHQEAGGQVPRVEQRVNQLAAQFNQLNQTNQSLAGRVDELADKREPSPTAATAPVRLEGVIRRVPK